MFSYPITTQMRIGLLVLKFVILVLGSASTVWADVAQAPSHIQTYSINSGTYNGNGQGVFLAYTTRIEVSDATWLQVNFASASLGSGSYVMLTSVLDGGQQRLTETTMAQWQNTSAYFNGNAVDVALYVALNDQSIGFTVNNVLVGDPASPFGIESQCGPTDDRIASNDTRVGRLMTVGCTAWIIQSGRLVTAGHCFTQSRPATVLQFNVPASASNGTVRHPGPNDQYAVISSSITYSDGGIGDDWGTFQVFPNPNTGLLPLAAQGASFTVFRDLGPSTIRITGYGRDVGTANQTQQTATGPNAGSSGTVMRYQTDTENGNSGSPVIDEATGRAVGVHSHRGCNTDGTGSNRGTSMFNANFWNAIDPWVQVIVKNEFKNPNNIVLNGGIVNVDFLDIDTGPLGGQYTTSFILNSQHRFEAKEQTYQSYYREFNPFSQHQGGWIFPNETRLYYPVINTEVQAGTYTAKYRNRYDLTAAAAAYIEAGSGGTYKVNGTNVGSSWTGTVWQYESVTLEAVPPAGGDWVFVQWSDGSRGNPRSVTPSNHTTLSAVFKQHLKANTSLTISPTAQRKLVLAETGTVNRLFLAYESGGGSFRTAS